ncbi:MAG: cobyrinate a,c-diamide synthase [Negativicutes bacterium]|nr:cobyrinate a,c-diamide synthase [Negativicutes bacterium]
MEEKEKLVHRPRLVIAGTQSGVGKTTLVTGLLAALRSQGKTVQSFKIGPDYIDPGFHALASGRAAHNLDSWLVPQEKLPPLFVKAAAEADISIIEGVMGLYDGGRQGISSTASLAKLLQAPVVLVLDAKSMGESAAAIALGFRQYDPEVWFAGVILNRVGSASHERMVREALERQNIPVLGCLHRQEDLRLPERHLGLTPVTEQALDVVVAAMGRSVGQALDLEALCALAQTAPDLPSPAATPVLPVRRARLGVARDEAFSFYYPESMGVLTRFGAELIPFSPLEDASLPEVDGLFFGGGFPEMFAPQLAANASMREAVRRAAASGMPIYAECGGLMYLTESLEDFSGKRYAMAQVVPARCRMEKKLQTVGYVTATLQADNLLGKSGARFQGHEFHFSSMEPLAEPFPWAFSFEKMRTGAVYPGGYASPNVLASYLHLHFAGNEEAAEALVTACAVYAARRQGRG